MPKITAPMAMTTTMDDLGDSIQETVKKVHRVLDAKAVSETLKALGISTDGSSEIRQITEAFSGLATGLKGIGELQAAVLGQVKDHLAGSKNGMSLADLIGLVLALRMLEPKQEKKDDTALEKLLNYLVEENRELKKSRNPSPVDQQINSLTTQLLSQHIASVTDPFLGLQRLAQMKEQLKGLFTDSNGLPPEYSEGALRLRALEKEEKALASEESKYLAELNYKHKLWSEYIPRAGAAIAGQLANALAAFGLTPVRPLQFDGEASREAEALVGENS